MSRNDNLVVDDLDVVVDHAAVGSFVFATNPDVVFDHAVLARVHIVVSEEFDVLVTVLGWNLELNVPQLLVIARHGYAALGQRRLRHEPSFDVIAVHLLPGFLSNESDPHLGFTLELFDGWVK